jgi:hypothetical protein
MRSLLIVRLAALALCLFFFFVPLLEFPEPGAGRNSFFATSGQYLHFTGLYLTLGTRVMEDDRLTVPAKVEKNWIGGDAAMSLLLLLPLCWFALSLIPRLRKFAGLIALILSAGYLAFLLMYVGPIVGRGFSIVIQPYVSLDTFSPGPGIMLSALVALVAVVSSVVCLIPRRAQAPAMRFGGAD